MAINQQEKEEINVQDVQQNNKLFGAAIILGISTIGGILAGTISAKRAKKKCLQYFKDINLEPKTTVESPHFLALRALAWATFYSLGFFSIAIFAACNWYGISNMNDLRAKLRPLVKSKNTSTDERTDFESLSDFLQYLNDTYSKPKGDENTNIEKNS